MFFKLSEPQAKHLTVSPFSFEANRKTLTKIFCKAILISYFLRSPGSESSLMRSYDNIAGNVLSQAMYLRIYVVYITWLCLHHVMLLFS